MDAVEPGSFTTDNSVPSVQANVSSDVVPPLDVQTQNEETQDPSLIIDEPPLPLGAEARALQVSNSLLDLCIRPLLTFHVVDISVSIILVHPVQNTRLINDTSARLQSNGATRTS